MSNRYPTKDARKWLEIESKRLTLDGQTWSVGRPWGDLRIPPDGLLLHEPLELPLRCNLIGPHSQITDVRTFRVADDFPEGGTAIKWEASRSQGNFCQQVKNVDLDCNNRAEIGIILTGDQGSYYQGLRVENALDTGIIATGLTHGATLINCWVKMSPEDEPLRGTAIHLTQCSGVTLLGTSVHRAAIGLVKYNCSNVADIGTDFERIVMPYDWFNAVVCDSTSHHMLHTNMLHANLDGRIGEFVNCEHSTVRGTLRKGESKDCHALVEGKVVPLSNQAHKNDPKPFRLDI